MENKITILLVEDNDGLANYVSVLLTSSNYNVLRTSKGKEAISMAASYCPDLILLNMGLPDIGGLEVLKTIRLWSNVPIIFVTGNQYENTKVEAFDSGADDYITKPFSNRELLARIKTELRHSQKIIPEDPIRCVGDIVVDLSKRTVTVAGENTHLTPIEYKMLLLFINHAGKILTYDFIIKQIWGPYTNETYESELLALRVNIANIRKKIKENTTKPRYILTEIGIGYKMSEN
jgi:two-component system KDP operon response regulator KdpE